MTHLHGRTLGLKKSQVHAIEKLAQRRVPADWAMTFDLAREMGALASETGRCLGLLVDRRGRASDVLVGDAHHVELPDLWGDRVAPDRLRGVRFARTAFTAGPLAQRDLRLLSRFRLDMVMQMEFDAAGEPLTFRTAVLNPAAGGPVDRGSDNRSVDGNLYLVRDLAATGLRADFGEQMEAIEQELERRTQRLRATGEQEAALLLSVFRGARDEAEESLRELAELARAALLAVAATEIQRRPHPDPRTFVGAGKIDQLVQRAAQLGAGTLVIDGELTGTQARNLGEATGLAVIDRTDLILRIFERRATTRDAKIRVELARLRYELPRLVRRDESYSRIGRAGAGGAGVRGKGERRLELDRRVMRDRIHRLEEELERIARQRREGRKRRVRTAVPVVALVGYTNAGKSTLMNELTDADVLAENLLFATVDPTSRKLHLPSGRGAVLTDTVGFLRALPAGLVDSFRATLEELGEADVLVHLVDAADADSVHKHDAVVRTLQDMGLGNIPRITLFNKADLVDREAFGPIARRLGGELFSARSKEDRAMLLRSIDATLDQLRRAARADESGDEPGDDVGHGGGGRRQSRIR